MKKILSLLILLSLTLTGCGNTAETEQTQNQATSEVTDNLTAEITDSESDEETAENISTGNFNDNDFEKHGYIYSDSSGDITYYYTVKNNSKSAVRIDAEAASLDAAGNSLHTAKGTIILLGPGETSIMKFTLYSGDNVDKVECSLSYSDSNLEDYKPVISDISLKQTQSESKIIIEATNNGQNPAQNVMAHALFFDADNNLVYCNEHVVSDVDGELKPGDTLAVQFSDYEESDHVEFYLTGSFDEKLSRSTDVDVSDDDFSVKEYIQDTKYDSRYYLAITNNSDKDVSIYCNALAYDSKNNLIGASYNYVNVIGANEETLMRLCLNTDSAIDHVEYHMIYSAPTYIPVMNDLKIEQNLNGKIMEISATNEGEETIDSLQAYVLFFDASDKVVYADSRYIQNGSDLRSGGTASVQIESKEEFDHAECYFIGSSTPSNIDLKY